MPSILALLALALMSAPMAQPKPIGYRRDGRPIYAMAGGDGTIDEIKSLFEQFRAQHDQRFAEIEKFGEATAETNAKVEKITADLMALQAQLTELETAAKRPTRGARNTETIGQRFVNSEEFQAWLKANGPSLGGRQRLPNMPPAYFDTLLTGGDAASGGALIVPDQSGIVVPFGRRPLTVLDLVTMGNTNSDSVEYVRVTDTTNNAAGVAESTATADPVSMDAASGVKPESEMVLQRVNAPVQTIAHWIPATRRALSDAGQLRTLIDAFLRAGVKEELENQAINGSGSGEEIEGFETAITLDQGYSDTLTNSAPFLETTRKAITKVYLAHSVPRAFLFHPNDWEAIELERLDRNTQNEGVGGSVPTLHGLPVAVNEAVDEGKGYVGDFRQYVIWDREQASISVSDSHANFFIRNLIALLGEMRAAGGLLKTDAICRIDLTS